MHMLCAIHSSFLFPNLVLTSSLLTSLELVKVPSADGQTALILVHAFAESVDIVRARARRLVHLCGVGLVCLCEFGVLRSRLSGRG
jgi:hypothetical protein